MSQDTLPNLDESAFAPIDAQQLFATADERPPRILLLYGSLRERSFSRLCAEEGARVLRRFGAETRIFNPSGLPCRTMPAPITTRSGNCANWQPGVTALSGARPSVTVR